MRAVANLQGCRKQLLRNTAFERVRVFQSTLHTCHICCDKYERMVACALCLDCLCCWLHAASAGRCHIWFCSSISVHFCLLVCVHFYFVNSRQFCHSVHTGSDDTLHQVLPEPVCPYNGHLLQPSCAAPSSKSCCVAEPAAARASCHAVLCSCEFCLQSSGICIWISIPDIYASLPVAI